MSIRKVVLTGLINRRRILFDKGNTHEHTNNEHTTNMKLWRHSRTNWLNTGAAVATIVGAFAQYMGVLQGVLTLEEFAILSVIVNVLNLVLRKYFTTTAIK